jgi:voltage-dependent anion channel protein 2
MAPPVYGDLGKSAKDVFGKGFHFGEVKLDVKTKAANGLEISAGGTSKLETGVVAGNIETKYKCKEYGVTITDKWTTDNKLNTTIDVEDQILKGLKLTFDSTFAPQTGEKCGKIKSVYKHDLVSVNADMDLNLAGPTVNASAVVGCCDGWLAGYSLGYSTQQGKLTKSSFGCGYAAGNTAIHASVADGKLFNASIYNRTSPRLETGVELGWTTGKNETTFGIGAKYGLDGNASVRAKVDLNSQVGLSYQQKLRKGVTVTFSTLVDGKSLNQPGGHKLGIALDLEA